jgi:hypothetical protein
MISKLSRCEKIFMIFFSMFLFFIVPWSSWLVGVHLSLPEVLSLVIGTVYIYTSL